MHESFTHTLVRLFELGKFAILSALFQSVLASAEKLLRKVNCSAKTNFGQNKC